MSVNYYLDDTYKYITAAGTAKVEPIKLYAPGSMFMVFL